MNVSVCFFHRIVTQSGGSGNADHVVPCRYGRARERGARNNFVLIRKVVVDVIRFVPNDHGSRVAAISILDVEAVGVCGIGQSRDFLIADRLLIINEEVIPNHFVKIRVFVRVVRANLDGRFLLDDQGKRVDHNHLDGDASLFALLFSVQDAVSHALTVFLIGNKNEAEFKVS